MAVENGQGEHDASVLSVTVEQGECPQALGEDIEVMETIGFSDWYSQEESEVRVDLAADMERVNKNFPEKPIESGMEVPVEYAAGLEPSEEREVIFHDQEALETIEAAAEGTVTQGFPGEDAAAEGIQCTPAEPLDDPVELSVSQARGWEEEAPQQLAWEEEVTVDDPPVEVMAAPQEETSEEEEVICSSEEPDLEAAADIDDSVEISGEGLVVDDLQPEEPSSSSMHTPQSKPVVEWSNFPEPMHRRRRNRSRPV